MMRRTILLSAFLALTACGSDNGVMDEIERAETQEAARSVEVTEAPVTLASGVEIQFTRRATDETLAKPGPDANVLVHYEGSLVSDGSVFDSSFERGEPAEFPLSAVVRGFSEAIQQMRPGDELIASFPAELGYGARGRPPVIPPNSALRFRIRLIAYQAADGSVIGQP